MARQKLTTQKPGSLIGQLRDMHARLSTGKHLSPAQRGLLVDSLAHYLDDVAFGEATASLDRSFGLKAWGGVSAARQDALSSRDKIIRQLWRTLPAWRGLSSSAVSRLILVDAERYQRERWPRERGMYDAPDAEPAASWWRILSSGARIPSSVKQLRRILELDIQEGV